MVRIKRILTEPGGTLGPQLKALLTLMIGKLSHKMSAHVGYSGVKCTYPEKLGSEVKPVFRLR